MRKVALLSAVLASLFCMSSTLRAQTATGQITGTLKDASGAVMAGAKVTITNSSRGFTRETTTSESGDYSFPLLPVGAYTVTAEQTGFRSARQSDIQLNVDQVLRVDLDLAVGDVSEVIEVQGSGVALDTENSSVGQTITERQVTELPLNGRNFLQLLFLNGGTVEVSGEQGSMRQGAGNAISINGSRPTSNNYMLDGTSNTDTALGTPAVVLSVDAIQEFKEQTATYSAEYGFSANQVNIISKTGTNDFHGTLFHFVRNDALDARSFFEQEISPLRQNQFGFVAGGPVLLPKFGEGGKSYYSGKNKTFWLFNYEGARIRRSFQGFANVPTADELAGRFTTPITDPLTGQPFPGNVIPQERFSRLAQLATQKFFPAPNANLPQGNFVFSRSNPNDTNQFTVRVDQNLGRYGTVFGRYTQTKFDNTTGSGITPIGETFFTQESKNWQISHSVPIGQSLVNQFRIGRVDATADLFGPAADPGDISTLGLIGVFTDLSDTQRGYPGVAFSRGGLAGVGGAVNDSSDSNQPMWDLGNTTTWIRGNHTLSFGANYRRWQLNRDLATDFLGNFGFSGDFTGNPIADMLLGYYSSTSVFQPAAFSIAGQAGNPRSFNFQYFAPYVQDDWKVNPRLTINLGVRWDYRTVPYETNDRMGWLNVANPSGGMFVADQTLVSEGIIGDGSFYTYAGRRNPREASKNVFAPRLGFAFRPFDDDKTVVRGGYGVFFDSAEGREIDGSADIYPYVSRGNYIQSLGQLTPLLTTDQLFPSFSNPGPVTPAANSFIAVIMSATPENPYVQQWSLGVQRELFRNTTFDLNYIGNKGTHLLMRRNIAQALPPSDPAFCAANPTAGDCPVAARKPYPNFGVYIDSDWSGNSIYNAMNAKFEHRSGSLLVTTVYTWARSIDSKSAAAGIGRDVAGWQGFLNNHDVKRDRGLSDFDVDHRLVSSFVYNLPFGRGQRFLSDSGKLKDAALGGWQLNGIATFQKGFPYPISASDLGGVLDTFGTNRANLVGDPNPSGFTPTIAQWFNTAAFTQPAFGVMGNSGRNILRGPGINNLDLALFKNFAFTETMSLQLRAEAFNALNHTQFFGPISNVSDRRFGQITSARPGRIVQLGAKFLW